MASRTSKTTTRRARMVVEGYGPMTTVGELCRITRGEGEAPIMAEVVGFRGDRVLLMPLGDMRGIGPASRITMTGQVASLAVGPLLGRILDGCGDPIDGKGMPKTSHCYPLHAAAPNPLQRARIRDPLDLGIRAINGFLTCGRGQKMGIFSGSGVGKSVLLGMISRYTKADVNVIALLGERGREVNVFLERDLGADALARTVVVVATSDQAPLIRLRAALVATTIAEYFRDAVLEIVDPNVLKQVVDEIDGIDFAKLGTDVNGDIFEYLLTHLGQSALNGQFRTPRQIRTMMVEMN